MPSEIADRGPAMLSSLPWMRMMPASSLSMPEIARASSVRPDPSSPGDAEHLALHEVDVRLVDAGPDAQRAGAEVGLLAPVGEVQQRARPQRVRAAPQHRLHQVDPQELASEVLADELAVAQHRHAVADLVDLVEEVGDEEDRHAALLEVADDAEQLGALVQVQARRRLVEHQHPDVGEDRPRDGHQLLHGQRVPAQDRGRVDVEPEVGEDGTCACSRIRAQSIIPNRRGSQPSAMFSATEMFGTRSISW